MKSILCVIYSFLPVMFFPALLCGQDSVDVKALVRRLLSHPTLNQELLEGFDSTCKIATDDAMAVRLLTTHDDPEYKNMLCKDRRHWERLRHYVKLLTMSNRTTARFTRQSGIGAPWLVRYMMRCREPCRLGTVGFEIRLTHNGRKVTRVQIFAR